MSPLHTSQPAGLRTARTAAGLPLTLLASPKQADPEPLFLDDDLSVMAFQRHLFEEVRDERNPLLERVKFLAILGVNLARLAGRKRSLARAAGQLLDEAESYLARHLRPSLASHRIALPPIAALTASTLGDLWQVSQLDRPDLRDPALQPHNAFAGMTGSPFDAIRAGDILLHHPYDSFQLVVDLIRQAGADPDVLEIALTVYRMDGDSPIGGALVDALRRGKQVRVIVELTAKHDEQSNAQWAAALRRAGADVTCGIVGLKVHAKLALIVRREATGIRRYVHVSSGNYHAGNALAYTDLALFTCDDGIAADVREIFDFLGGRVSAPACKRLLVAPFTMRRRLCDLLEREIEWSRRGVAGHVVLKVNSLSDRDVIRQLYRASQAGVRVDLVVRGVCRLRPGVAGLSDRIHVRSIVGRFLEHSRAWYFRNGGNHDVYIGSADLRTRNLDRRLEALVPIADATLARRIRHNVLGAYLADTASARVLWSDGTYARAHTRPGERALSSQRALLEEPAKGFALDIPIAPLAGCQHLLARSARLGPLCEPEQGQNSRNEPHSGLITAAQP